jgi:hypothetical protein
MKFSKGCSYALMLLAVCVGGRAGATSLLDIPGPTGDYFLFWDGALADSWTQNFSVTNGSVSVLVQGQGDSGGTIHFYLTTNIGPTATLSDLVAVSTEQVPSDLTTVTPFLNLNLGPGTYYLIMADYNDPAPEYYGPAWNYHPGTTGIQTIPGLTLNAMQTATSLGPYAPAADFYVDPYDESGVLSFTGTIVPTPPVPEPTTLRMLVAGLIAFGVAHMTRLRAAT